MNFTGPFGALYSRRMRSFLGVAFAALIAVSALTRSAGAADTAEVPRPRLLVLTDIGGDPDDQQSMVRLMHYANEFEIEGLIASAAGTPGELKQRRTNPQLIREVV